MISLEFRRVIKFFTCYVFGYFKVLYYTAAVDAREKIRRLLLLWKLIKLQRIKILLLLNVVSLELLQQQLLLQLLSIPCFNAVLFRQYLSSWIHLQSCYFGYFAVCWDYIQTWKWLLRKVRLRRCFECCILLLCLLR